MIPYLNREHTWINGDSVRCTNRLVNKRIDIRFKCINKRIEMQLHNFSARIGCIPRGKKGNISDNARGDNLIQRAAATRITNLRFSIEKESLFYFMPIPAKKKMLLFQRGNFAENWIKREKSEYTKNLLDMSCLLLR